MEPKRRLLYIDNLRLLVIILVVVQHLAVTYSGFGSWYYKEGQPLGLAAQTLFGFYQSLTQGYFMGLLFLVAGYFVPAAYDRKGFGRFMKDRLIRLGVPTLLYMLAIYPLVVYGIMGGHGAGEGFFPWYARYIVSLDVLSGTGPLWFALALLIFTFVYALVRLILGKKRVKPALGGTFTPKAKHIAGLIAVIAAFAFLIRIVLPVGVSVMNMLLGYFAQYIVLFPVGIFAYRNGLFSKLDYRAGRALLIGACTWGFAVWGIVMVAGGSLKDITALNGGFTWQSAAFSLWESFTGVAMDIGLITVFREKCNSQGKLVKALSASAFAVYVFHAPIIVAITRLFGPVQWLPGFKFAAMCLVCLPVCFAAAYYGIRRIPLLKKVM